MTDSTNADFSLLLWLLGGIVAGLAIHVAHGWARLVHGAATLRG